MKTILKSQTNLLRLVKVWQKDKLKLTISNCGRDTHTRFKSIGKIQNYPRHSVNAKRSNLLASDAVAAMTAFVRMSDKETPLKQQP